MPVYTGRVQVKDFFNELKNKLDASGLWTDISSLATDGCWRSNARNDILIVLRDNNTQTASAQHSLTIGIAERYTPGGDGIAGTFTNLITNTYNFASKAISVNTYDVSYWLYVDTTCIILVTMAEPLVTDTLTNAVYLGLPVLYDENEPDNTANTLAIACSAPTAGAVKVLRNKARAINQNYTVYSFATQVPLVPGWGNKYQAFPIAIGINAEGLRGELKHMLCMPYQNILNLDTVVIGDKTYRVFVTSSFGNNSFPTRCLLLPTTM